MTQPFSDGRHFKLGENVTHIWRITDPATGQRCGVKITIAFGQFETTPVEYFTSDGETFTRAVYSQDRGLLSIEKVQPEANDKRLEALRNAFVIWQAASGESRLREAIRSRCDRLWQMLASIPHTLPHLQDVRRLSEQSQTAPNEQVPQVDAELNQLILRLRATEIINPERFEEYLSEES